MKIIINPKRTEWLKLTRRPSVENVELKNLVKDVFVSIKNGGDMAVRKYSHLFDKVNLKNLQVKSETISSASKEVSKELKVAIGLAKQNIEKFHSSQVESSILIETTRGVSCWRESRGIEKIGIYIPGGTAPLFSTVLMLGIPAKIAGCKEIILCTPPNKKGEIDPVILYAANLVEITSVYSVGGIQAIAAMTYGTKSIPKVDKIFGPGNQYVTAAKLMSQNLGVAIDMPAGPSEVLIIADKTCNPSFVAADLLSQAEHGADSQVILLSDNEKVIEETLSELNKQLKELPRKSIAEKALKNSKAIVLKNINECIDFSNEYAPEHLILAIDKAKKEISSVINAGSVFLGNYSCESAGDYASGTNHTLPTNGYARAYSGVSLDSFVKKITFQELTKEGIKNIGPAIELMAEAEQLFAHKNAVTLRLKSL
ncbi:MAG: histidinol dehydrogenase [Flavobacteriaceae bacterium]|jgi:histidinol dehydrogenase|nr:histidinol dehydrogenase [Flavobacteriaceae bacterium]